MADDKTNWADNIGKAPEIGEFKGHPTITLYTERGAPFSFGKAKAQTVLDNIEAIRNFVGGDGESDPF